MLSDQLSQYKIICGSGSPRRQYLLKELGLDFEVRLRPVDEEYPEHLQGAEIPVFLSLEKAKALKETLSANELLITADTIVWLDGKALNKPSDEADAMRMVRELSGRMHQVFTGVSITTHEKQVSFSAETKVWFKDLSEEEVIYYVHNFKPMDKAGAYGAQEWIGYVAVTRIDGTYFNVMGLPLAELYDALMKFSVC